MVAQSNHEPMSVEEYLAIEATAPNKHEYVDGWLYAMSGGTVAHDRIANNVRSLIDGQLGTGPCTLHGPDIQLRVSPTVYYYPDVIVACDGTIEDDAPAMGAGRISSIPPTPRSPWKRSA